MADRCTGHCCRRFTLRQSPVELWENYQTWLERIRVTGGSWQGILEEIWVIAPMVRYLGSTYTDVNGEPAAEEKHWYRCIHLADGRECAIYEHRPRMCREYPYGKACKYHGCTWDAAREGRVNEKSEETPPDVNRLPNCQPPC